MAATPSPASPPAAPPWGAAALAMYRAAQAVAQPSGPALYGHLVAELAAALPAACVFIAVFSDDDRRELHTLAATLDGRQLRNFSYTVAGSPCAQVVGRSFRYVAAGVAAEFPPGTIFGAKGMDSYAAFPLADAGGTPLGLVVAMDRRPIADPALCEALLKIFAVRAAAEIEQSRAREALRRSEASYRAIFEAAEDAVFIHDWDTGVVLDVNPKACATCGYSHDELCGATLAQVSSGVPPYTAETALHHIELARLGRARPFEWHRRNKDGSLHWDEVRLNAVEIDGQRRILAFTREITEHKAALAALRAQEQKYRAIFDGTVDSMVLWDRELRVVDVNDAFVKLTGLAREQVVGLHWSERPDADDLPQLMPLIDGALQGRVGEATLEVSHADGGRFEIELRYLPMHFGDETFALGVGRDVSQRLHQERRLRDSEAQYRAIFNASADALVLRDAAFRIVDVNETYVAMTGYDRAAVIGQDRVLANPPEVADTLRVLHARALAGEQVELETQLVHGDGGRYELELRGMPILHRGEPHVLYIGRDITERKRAERALRASEEQYRAIFNASADALILWNSRFERVDVNPAYETIYGRTRDEVVGRSYDEPQFSAEYARMRRELVRRALGGEAAAAVLEAVRKDGQRIVTEVNAIPFTHRGEPHVLAIARDITERREAELQRARLENQLRQAQKMETIGQLTGGIAHDFNNILTSVLGYLVLALERAEALGDATLQRQLGRAQRAAQRARDLIAQMLAFARRQHGERRVVALAPLVRQTLQLLRATLPATVAVDDGALDELDDGGDNAAGLRVAADAVQLEQVLFNLCINARDAIHGPGLIRVGLRGRGGGWQCSSCREQVDHGRWIELAVADDGEGMAPEVVERIFEPFFSTKEVGRGSGMGLAMVHGIVHDHGGHVVVRSAPGAGSTFGVLLPAAAADTADEPPHAAADTGATTPARLPRARVLVVEDEALVGDFMAELLSGWGLDVVLQRDPLQAADWIADPANEFDLLLTDKTMPSMTGLALARHVASLRPGLPVLLYTGNAASVDVDQSRQQGVSAVLRKPVDPQALRAALRRYLPAPGADPA